jgi:hypothetical protein
MIKKEDILSAQQAWGDALVRIGRLKDNKALCAKETEKLLRELYAVDKKEILFKPTKAAEIQFRPTLEAAKSYFIGGNEKFPEDNGFALQPWIKVRFENAGFILEENRAIAMGNYYFTDLNGDETKVEYTFGYIKTGEGLKIDLHHSSMPYSI